MAPLGGLLWLVARMPRPVAGVFSDALAFLAGKVVHYRRRIVETNIRQSFPGESEEWYSKTIKGFYRNLADCFFGTVRFGAMNARQVRRVIRFTGLDQFNGPVERGQSVVVFTSHFGNWEYVTTIPLFMNSDVEKDVLFAHVARPLKNLWFNRYFHRLRSRWNTSVPMKSVSRTMMRWRRDGQPFVIGFLSDQKPGRYTRSCEVEFLGRTTPFIQGTEELARHFGSAVYYADMQPCGRGVYQVEMIPMCQDASQTAPGELTARYAAMLTATIRRHPSHYLWSHNRWRLPKRSKL